MNTNSRSDYETKESIIQAIPDEQIVTIPIPVSVALEEAEALYETCLEDKNELVSGTDLSWDLVEDLPLRAGALRYLQAKWLNEFRKLRESQKEWHEVSPDGFNLRDELVHIYYYAYRNTPDIYSKVQLIDEGGSSDDLIQDLMDLAVLGKQNPGPLEAINMDMSLLEKAEKKSDELADLLARVNGARDISSPAKILRDKAFVYMKEAVDEIRVAGQYLFWRDEDKRKYYVSRYYKRRNRRRSVTGTEESLESTE